MAITKGTSNEEEYALENLPVILAKQTISVINQICRDVNALAKEAPRGED
jgi:hypothetical protein